MPQLSSPYSHYVSASPMLQVVTPDAAAVNSQLVAAQAGAGGYGAPASKLQRSDRIEVGCFSPSSSSCPSKLSCASSYSSSSSSIIPVDLYK